MNVCLVLFKSWLLLLILATKVPEWRVMRPPSYGETEAPASSLATLQSPPPPDCSVASPHTMFPGPSPKGPLGTNPNSQEYSFPLGWLLFYFIHFSCMRTFVSFTGQRGEGLTWDYLCALELAPILSQSQDSGWVTFPDAKPSGAGYPICEWRYDACTSPCFQTCRDPQAASCRDVPR